MKIFIVIYMSLMLISFVAFYFIAGHMAKEQNELFEFEIARVSLCKTLMMAVFFPFTWTAAVIHAIMYREEE